MGFLHRVISTCVDTSTLALRIDACQYGAMSIAPSTDGRTLLSQAVERCCATEGSAPITREDAEVVARLLKAVADPVRLQILGIVRCSPGQEVCACDLPEPLGLAQPTVSHHLKVLVDAGLLARERRGQWAWFTLVPDRLALARQVLEV